MHDEVTWQDLVEEHEAQAAIDRLTQLMDGWEQLGAGQTLDLAVVARFIKSVIKG